MYKLDEIRERQLTATALSCTGRTPMAEVRQSPVAVPTSHAPVIGLIANAAMLAADKRFRHERAPSRLTRSRSRYGVPR
jgi:hypothetical protein